MRPILEIKDLTIGFEQEGIAIAATDNISLSLYKGQITAIVGESGSGKSVTALSVLGLLPAHSKINGSIIYHDGDNRIELKGLADKKLNNIRGNRIAMIFQEPMTSLNPVFTCGYQVMESLIRHRSLSRTAARKRAIELFREVELPDPASMINRYPHQISGGQKQRVMIAMAMSCEPDILIADEPTTALDVRVQANILSLIKRLQNKSGMAVMLITHDLGLVSEVADDTVVMYRGKIMEHGSTKDVLLNPKHDYTKALLASRPSATAKGMKLAIVKDFMSGKIISEPIKNIETGNGTILSIQNLSVHFPFKKNLFGNTTAYTKAVDDVTFSVNKNEVVGLVGESGCGKTTLGRTILQLIKPTSGRILLEGKDISHLSPSHLREVRKDLQIVFQDPYGSLNPRISIGSAILEPLNVHKIHTGKKERKENVIYLLEKVGLQADHYNRYPHQFSGGQRQRICIARALALQPSFLVFDESVSALDVSVQAQVLNLINDLRADPGFTSIFISHDLSVVHHLSDRILVMKDGKIIEEGSADKIYNHPEHRYTIQLIEAIPGRNKK